FDDVRVLSRAIPTLGDLNDDGALDILIGDSAGRINYFRNTHIPLQSNQASLSSGIYNRPLDIQLRCDDCAHITYTLDGSIPTSTSLTFDSFVQIPTGETTLKFLTVDALGNPISLVTETYRIDTQPPSLRIDTPKSGLVAEVLEISGNVFDVGSAGLARIDLQIFSDPLYLVFDENASFPLNFNPRFTWNSLPFIQGAQINRFFGINEFTHDHDGSWSFNFSTEDPNFTLPEGTYVIRARAVDRAGNASETQEVNVIKTAQADTELSIKSSTPTLLNNGTLSVTGKLSTKRSPPTPIAENLADLPIELVITPPECLSPDCQITLTTNTSSDTGQYAFNDVAALQAFNGFTARGSYTLQTRFAGNDLLDNADSPPTNVLVGQSAGYVVLVHGRVASGEGLAAHRKTTDRIYRTLLERGFDKDNVYYYAWDTPGFQSNIPADEIDGLPIVEDFVTPEALQVKMNNSPAPFYLIMVDHGDSEGNFYIDNGNNALLTPELTDGWLTAIESGLSPVAMSEPRYVILGFCYAGQMVPSLSKTGRIVITSAAADEESYKGPLEEDNVRSGEFFMEELFQRLGQGKPFSNAFNNAVIRTELYTEQGRMLSANALNRFGDRAVQHPLIDLDGDGVGSNTLSLENVLFDLSTMYLGAGVESLTNDLRGPVRILSTTKTTFLDPDSVGHGLELKITVNDASRVDFPSVDIRPPLLTLDPTIVAPAGQFVEQREITGLRRVAEELQCTQNTVPHQCTLTLTPTLQCQEGPAGAAESVTCFDESGTYELLYFISDAENGDLAPVERSLIYKANPDNRPPSAPILLSPINGAKTSDTVIFEWEAAIDDTGPNEPPVTYLLQIAEVDKQAIFGQGIVLQAEADNRQIAFERQNIPLLLTQVDQTAVVLDSRTNGETGLIDGQQYAWRVWAIDHFGGASISSVRTFMVDKTNLQCSEAGACGGCSSSIDSEGICRPMFRIESSLEVLNIGRLKAPGLSPEWLGIKMVRRAGSSLFELTKFEPVSRGQANDLLIPTLNYNAAEPTSSRLNIPQILIANGNQRVRDVRLEPIFDGSGVIKFQFAIDSPGKF
ncbi:MAG: chitobiase/beta-hexosaminidase C-terminal domain-containing protein, partial [Pseudomonadota bacterium]